MKKRIINVILFIALCSFLLIGYYYLNKLYGFSIPCPIHKITGYYCPGCGITRCLFYLMTLDIKKAFRSNQLVFILLPFIALYFFYNIYLYIFDKKDTIMKKIPNYIFIIILIIVIAFGIVRNLDGFEYLRP